MYEVYARIFRGNVISSVRTSAKLKETTGWTKIGETEDANAYSDYVWQDEFGLYNYKYEDGEIKQIDNTAIRKKKEARQQSAKYIPSFQKSAQKLLQRILKTETLTTEEKMEYSGAYDEWTLGSYDVGDIRNHAGQTWECWTAHDNAIYPDINPDNPQTWANFWRPLHGKTAETARPWTKPWAGTTDMYHAGEYMVYTDGKTYKCLSDTVYSPEEYAQAWEAVTA